MIEGAKGRGRLDWALTVRIEGRSNAVSVARRILLQVAIAGKYGIESSELRTVLGDIPERTFYRGLERLQAQKLIHNGREYWRRKTWYLADPE